MTKVATARVSARSTSINFEEKYQTGYCIPTSLRDEQIKIAIKKVSGRVQPYDGKRTDPIAVVGFGPSLKKTWREIRKFKYIITTSGAHKFLIEKGIIPTWHLDVDPRAHKVKLLGDIRPEVTYLPCSTQHPNYLDALIEANAKVELWHCFSSEAEALRVLPPGEYALTGGCDAGMRAMAMARFFGFVNQHVFGMDGCAENEKAHAHHHPNTLKKFFDLEYPKGSGKIFRTAPNLAEVAKTVPHETNMLKLDSIKFYGDGLVQAIMKDYQPNKNQQSNIAFVKPVLISEEYREMNRTLHDTIPEYGMGGVRHAETVAKLCANLKTTSVLDYGCGKGTLALNLPFPIWEYDPAIQGKDHQPRPADIVVCTDVLEHIEPEKLPDVLGNLAALVIKVGYFVISTRAAQKLLHDGRNAHLIQKDSKWWKDALTKYFDIGQLFEGKDEIQVVVGPRKKPTTIENTEVVEKNGIKARYTVINDTTKWRVKTLFTKEPATIRWIESIPKGEVLYDVGANMGGYSIWAGRHGVKVYAFEPEAANYSLLCRNIELNKIDATAFCAALSDENKLASIYLSTQDAGGSCNSFGESVGPNLQPRKGINQGAIGYRMDSIVDQLPEPDHIKIDVDGFEHKVIEGAAKLLESGKVKSLLVEVNTNLPEHLEMLERLKGWGYHFDEKQVQESMRKDGPFKGCAEYVFRLPNAVEQSVIDKIKKAKIIKTPYPHLYIEDVLPADFYEKLMAEMPTDGYQSLEEARGTKGYPERFVHPAPACVSWLRHGAFKAAVDAKFGVESKTDEILLLQDHPGYKIPPHTDSTAKAVTALFYVTKDWTPAEHGTTVYKPKAKGFKDPEGNHHDFSRFQEVWTAPGKPNSVVMFARTDNSFHGAKPYKGKATRDILLYDSKS